MVQSSEAHQMYSVSSDGTVEFRSLAAPTVGGTGRRHTGMCDEEKTE